MALLRPARAADFFERVCRRIQLRMTAQNFVFFDDSADRARRTQSASVCVLSEHRRDNSFVGTLQRAEQPLQLAAEVVSSFVANNSVTRGGLLALIEAVHGVIVRLAGGAPSEATAALPKEPAVPVRKSITPDHLICLDDGRKFKSLRRHLSDLGMTPEQYRAKWNLPSDYPMVAPNYSARRSAMAKAMGFGRIRRKAAARASESVTA
jgi:predicted transcriptional regulator